MSDRLPVQDRPSRSRWMITVAAVVMAALTARLGWWQLDRADQKLSLQAAIEAQAQTRTLSTEELAREARDAEGQWHRPIRLQGEWVGEQTVFLDNRQMHGRPGFFIVTPLRLVDGTMVMVQRGWAPRDQLDRTRVPLVGSPPGEVVVDGRIAPWPSRLAQLGAEVPGVIRQNLDADERARSLGAPVRPLSVLQVRSMFDDGLLRDWPPPAIDVHKHYGYAAQWFTFSAMIAGLYVWFQHIQPRRRQRRR